MAIDPPTKPLHQVTVSEERFSDNRLDAQWMRERSASYRGQWVALYDGELLVSGYDRAHVIKEADKRCRLYTLTKVWDTID
jgi:hypothetical protein